MYLLSMSLKEGQETQYLNPRQIKTIFSDQHLLLKDPVLLLFAH